MKTTHQLLLTVENGFATTCQTAGVGLALALMAGLCGCATQNPAGVVPAGKEAPLEPVSLDPGAITVACSEEPVAFSFQKALGRTGYAAEGAGDVARACLDPPGSPGPGLDALYSPLGVLVAPAGAVYGALAATRARMSPDQLSQSESDLTRIMAAMADQKRLRKWLLEAAGEVTRRRLVPVGTLAEALRQREPKSTLLETRVEELRLERVGTKDTSFVLRIKARVRVHRAADGQVLYDLPLEYRSGPALFLDWTCPEAFQGVAETGYRELGRSMAERLLSAAAEGPVLVGAGYNRAPGRGPVARPLLAANRSPLQSNLPVGLVYASQRSSAVGVFAAEKAAPVAIQRPLTKDDAASEALSDVNALLDGLQNSRNLVVQLSACAVAVPLSLWKQVAVGIRGLPARTFDSADAQLAAAARQFRPQAELARQVALELTPRTAERVMLVDSHWRAGAEGASPVRWRVGDPAPLPQDPAILLEIQLRHAELTGDGRINPPLALKLEAEATLFRAEDGAEFYRCLVEYRSEERKFTAWAANDGQAFREEMQRGYRELSGAIVDRLVSRGVIAPRPAPQATVVAK